MATPPPTGLRSITITDFRRIDKLHLDFTGQTDAPSDLAVIAGPNGCGKTSVLEACLLALGYDGDLQGRTGPDAARTGCREWNIEAELRTSYGDLTTKLQSNGHAEWTDHLGRRQTHAPAVATLYFSSWRAPRLVGSLGITAGKRGRHPKDNEANRVWRIKQHLINAKAYRLMGAGPSGLFDQSEADLQRLVDAWTVFHPDQGDRFEVAPAGDDPDAGFDVFLCCRDGRRVSVDELSSGQLELFALFGSVLLTRFREGVVVVDEPELHLDPQWHAPVLRALRRLLPRAQMIVATHSPRVYDSAYSFQRHFLIPADDPRAVAWGAAVAEAAIP